MTGLRILLICIFFSIAMAYDLVEASPTDERSCREVQAILESKRKQLAEYLLSLKKSQPEGDAAYLRVLNYKISELLNEIVNIPEIADCRHAAERTKVKTFHGMGPIKFDTTEHCTKTCPELKKLLVQLVRKTSALQRREHSTFSELSDTENQELQDARREIRVIVEVMKARCGLATVPDEPKGARARHRNRR